jgi:hypothetical protein
MFVEVLTAFIPVHRLLQGSCGLLPEGHLPYARECYGMQAYIPVRVVITVGDEMSLCSQVYAVG